ncbi:hypothetical protein [Mesobacillus subterraneus]|uniref:UPF0738 protein UB32_18250 n=1 Tax=Mesobacillus subterraneus TaxID=285983 RepID=A0A0D6Z5Q1_9BACI|nr:hypothetical protein [Mesobacillus subterraneus]KIY20615.1 hypothetical protein UB32_18250 [Mesobacillus subterraneus]
MSKKIIVTEAKVEKEELLLLTDMETQIASLRATGQMLVDSDQLSFIYIVEKEDEYQYITIPEVVWSSIQQGLQYGSEIVLANPSGKLKLDKFRVELEYLIENITGNSNYGEEMVAKVEQLFAAPSA